jgi:peroxiredoxin
VRLALITALLLTACYRTHGYRGGKDLYEPVGIRPDNAAKATPPPEIGKDAVAVGAKAPALAATLPDHDWLVVVFYRGDWCPYCRAQLREIQAHAADFAQRKAAVAAVSVDSAETDAHLAEGLTLTFALVSDPGHRLIDKFGVFDGETELAWPSIFIVDRGGAVRWRWIADDFKKRITTIEVLAALDAAAGATAPAPAAK